MDTDQLKKVLSRDLGSSFGGVYPVDLIPDHLISNQKAIVINLDPHYKPGSHWVCLYLSGNRVEYFDSYGLPPFLKTSKSLLTRTVKTYIIIKDNIRISIPMCADNTVFIFYMRDIGEGVWR